MDTIRLLVKEPNKEPYIKEVELTLENLQKIVGGYIECVEMPIGKNIDLFVNEEGKLEGQDGNFWLPEYEDCVVGTCYMVGYDPENGESVSITDKQIADCKKYIDFFKIPEGMNLYRDFPILENLMKTQAQKFKKQECVM